MHRDELELAQSLSGVARHLLAEEDVAATLAKVVSEAIRLIAACEHAGIDLVRKGKIEALAPSSEVARIIDAIQVEVDQGPCLDALRQHEVYVTGDLAEEDRWPDFARRAFEATGIRSIAGFRLWVAEDTMGALNLYSTRPDAFDDEAIAIGSVLAAHAAVALSTARRKEQLQEALRTRDLIGQAKGKLRERHGIGEDEAFVLLRDASQRLQIKLRDLAQRFVDGEELVENHARS